MRKTLTISISGYQYILYQWISNENVKRGKMVQYLLRKTWQYLSMDIKWKCQTPLTKPTIMALLRKWIWPTMETTAEATRRYVSHASLEVNMCTCPPANWPSAVDTPCVWGCVCVCVCVWERGWESVCEREVNMSIPPPASWPSAVDTPCVWRCACVCVCESACVCVCVRGRESESVCERGKHVHMSTC